MRADAWAIGVGLTGLIAAAPHLPAPTGLTEARRATDTGLCRRAAPMPALPREVDRQPHLRPQRSLMTYDMAPPPPAPAEAPPPPSVAADASDVMVTGSMVRPPASISPAPVVALPEPPAARGGDSAFRRRDETGERPPAGLLTAGEHDDLLNPELYARYVDRFVESEPLPGIPRVDTARVLTVTVRDAAGRPVPFAPVTLTCADGNTLTLATVASGEAVFFPELDRLGQSVAIGVPGTGPGGQRRVDLSGTGAITQTVTAALPARAVKALDLALVIDTTGSMGDEIAYLQSELRNIVAKLRQRHPDLDLRVGLIAYRDREDEFVTRTYPFTADLARVQRELDRQRADGGGDEPESMEVAMARAAALPWRSGAAKSLLLIADAPPHAEDVAATWRAAEALRANRVQIVPVAASGVERGAEYVMRAMAAATQSRYLFLTDDSGIGNPHAAPAIDCYLVTRLADAMNRVLDSQLSGRRIEPERAEVIRTVGTYDAGRCILPRGWDRRQSD